MTKRALTNDQANRILMDIMEGVSIAIAHSLIAAAKHPPTDRDATIRTVAEIQNVMKNLADRGEQDSSGFATLHTIAYHLARASGIAGFPDAMH